MKPRGVIFDLDGTLLDSMGIWNVLPLEVVKHFGGVPNDDLPGEIAQMSQSDAAKYMIEKFHLACSVENIEAYTKRYLHALYQNTVPAKGKAVEFVLELSRLNIPCVVATASDIFCADAALKRLGIRDKFIDILSCNHYGDKTKPDIFFAAAKRFEGGSGDIWVVEDSLHAIQTAKTAGFKTLAVYEHAQSSQWPAIQATAVAWVEKLNEETAAILV